MRIAIACRRYYPEIGGIETHVKEIAERIAKKHDVLIFTLTDDKKSVGSEILNNVSVHRFKSLKLSYAAEFPPSDLTNGIAKFNPDIVHSHNVHTTMPYFVSRANCNAKVVINPHYQGNATTALRRFLFMAYKPLLNRAVRHAQSIICVSSSERDMLINDFSIDQSKIRIIPNGVGLDLFRIVPNRNELRILSVARFDLQHKRTDKVIKAFKILESEVNAKLVLVGSGPDKENIIKLIEELDLSEKVDVKSHLSRQELLQEYATASIFVTASEQEAFGISVAEALTAKLRVVVPNSTALSLFVKGGYALGIEAPITAEKIAKAILGCIKNNYQASEYPAYTWDMAADELHDVYVGLVEKNH